MGADLESRCLVDLQFIGQQFFECLACLLADCVAVLEEIHFVDFRQRIGNCVGQLVQLVAADPHSTALYWATSFCFTFLNISG